MQSNFVPSIGEKTQSCPYPFSKNKKFSSKTLTLASVLCLCLICLLSSCVLQPRQTNTPPSVRIISPQESEVFIASSLRVSIEAQDAEKNIQRIQVYENGQAIGEASRSIEQSQDASLPEQWHFNWTVPENGTFTFSAQAIDELGQKSTASVSFEVQLPSIPDPTAPQDGIAFQSYTQSLALWQQQNVNSYRIDFRKICFCLPDLTQPVKLSIEDQNLSNAIYLSGEAVDQSNYSHFYTINKAFSLIDEAFENSAAEIRVVYDQEFGFPTSVFIDYDERLADEELQFTFDNFIAN